MVHTPPSFGGAGSLPVLSTGGAGVPFGVFGFTIYRESHASSACRLTTALAYEELRLRGEIMAYGNHLLIGRYIPSPVDIHDGTSYVIEFHSCFLLTREEPSLLDVRQRRCVVPTNRNVYASQAFSWVLLRLSTTSRAFGGGAGAGESELEAELCPLTCCDGGGEFLWPTRV